MSDRWKASCYTMHVLCTEWDMSYGWGYDPYPLPRYEFHKGGSTDCSAAVGYALETNGYEKATHEWSSYDIAVYLGWGGWDVQDADNRKPARGCVLVSREHHVAMWDADRGVVMEFGGDPHKGYVTEHGWYVYDGGWDYYIYPPDCDEEDEVRKIYWCNGVGFLREPGTFVGLPDEETLNILKQEYRDDYGTEIEEKDIDENWRDRLTVLFGGK